MLIKAARIASLTVAGIVTTSVAIAALEVGANWTLEVAEINYETVASLHQDSQNSIADEYASKQVNPQLAFRCKPGVSSEVSIAVDWRRFISSFNTEVGFKVDDKELLLLNWGVDRSNKVTAPRSGGHDAELLDYLQNGSTLSIEVIPYAETLITVSYDISGIDTALEALVQRCAG